MKRWIPVAVLAALGAMVPLVGVTIPWVFTGPLNSPGVLQILSTGLVLAALAMSYDIIFGYTGLLSFGHALPFALGVYGTNLLMMHAGMGYFAAALAATALTTVISAALGAIALRATGVAFAMVTLAFAEAFHLLVITDPFRIFGREEGLSIASQQVPDFFRGVVNLRNVYWLTLALAVFTFVVARQIVRSRAGGVFEAIRENEPRVEMLGLRPFPFKLVSFTAASALAALAGSVHLLVVRGANIGTTTADFTLSILVMVVLGGAGRLWGAALGGVIYGYLTLRLAAVSTSQAISGLPDWISRPLSEPLFILGVIFMLLVLYVPGGLSSLRTAGRRP